MAGGLEVALACDLIVAARGARLGIPEVKRSLVAAGGALLRLPRGAASHGRDGAGADRGADRGRARPRAGPASTGWPSQVRPWPPRWSWPARSRPTGRWPWPPPSGSWSSRRTGPTRSSSSARGRSPTRSATPRTRARARPRSPSAATRSGRVVSRRTPPTASRPPTGHPAVAVLAQVDPLPGPEREPAARDRQRQRRPEQRRLDVRGHVVRTLERVRPVRRPVGHGSLNHVSKSRRTSGEAFSFRVSEAEVCWISRWSRPTERRRARAGADDLPVTRWKPRGRAQP